MATSRRYPAVKADSTNVPSDRPRYRFGRRIAGGAMGEIVHAEKIAADGTVLDDKLVAKRMIGALREHEEANARFVREVRLQKRLDHPNVMPIIAQNLSSRPPWFVMRRAERTLRDEIAANAGDRDWILQRMGEILSGVAHAHDRDVLHRDLKPSNVLIAGDVARVADFGLGKDLSPDGSARTRSTQEMGTRPYMAPEQVNDPKNVGKPADVYAMGKLLCHLATGSRPPALAVDLAHVAADYHYWIARCCETKPDRRYSDARQALEAFELLIATDPQDQDPIAVAEALAAAADQADDGADAARAIVELDEHLTRLADDEDLYLRVLPRLSARAIRRYADEGDRLHERLQVYDHHIDGPLDFEYCDKVARLYQRAFRATKDPLVHELVLHRLLEMGASHNRWMVGDTLAAVLASIKDRPTEALAASVLGALPHETAWAADAILKAKPSRRIGSVVRALVATP
jgi:serine/threonine protein kinase